MSEWKPIETAPKDRTKILFCGGTYGCEFNPCEFYGVKNDSVDLGYWCEKNKEFHSVEDDWDSGEGFGLKHFNPEFWMELPEPPK